MKNLTTYTKNVPTLFETFFNNFFDESFLGNSFTKHALTIDVEEKEDSYLISADLPGIKKENINIELKGKQLSIEAKQEEEKTEEGKYYRKERHVGEYRRILTLPEGIKPDSIEATLEDGVLTVSIEKAEPAKLKTISISWFHKTINYSSKKKWKAGFLP